MIASLPMYDRPETAASNDRLWDGVRHNLGRGPERLARDPDLPWHWRDPDLLLSQSCGLPYRTGLHETVTLVAAPEFDLPDCPPGHYYSRVVVRRDDPRREIGDFDGATLAFNGRDSQSGWAAALEMAATAGIAFGGGIETGAHARSAVAVAEGRAGIAVIDAVTWTMIETWDACAGALRVIGRTRPTPAMPYITAKHDESDALAEALAAAIAGLSEADRGRLRLRGIARLAPADFLAEAIPADPF